MQTAAAPFERIQQRHYGMKLVVYTLMNLPAFCGTSNSQPVTKLPASALN